MKPNIGNIKEMTGNTLLLMLALIFSLFGYTQIAQATVDCRMYGGGMQQNYTVGINVAAYVGNELPVGSTIYRTTISASNVLGVDCNGAFSLPMTLSVSNAPVGPPVNISGTNYGSGPVYPTNVSGVGIAVWRSGTLVSEAKPLVVQTYAMGGGGGSFSSMSFDISLIKTGPIASGSIVNASSFPTAILMIPATPGYTGLPIIMETVNFTGAVNFTTSTCTTPDVNVNMGSYDIPQNFKQVGSVTPWIDSSITLQNCPTFSGRYADQGTAQSVTGSGNATGTSRKATLLTVSLTPMSSIIDTANGVMAVDSGQGPDLVARGVGLQLGYTPTNMNASATSPTTIWKSGTSWDMQPSNDGRSNFKIPLAARYFQTSPHVTAGPANTKVVFNIDYK